MSGRPMGVSLERKDIYAQEFKQLLAYLETDTKLKPRTKANAEKAFYLLYHFGFRVGELVLLKNHHIKKMVEEKVISLGNDTKTKTPREAYISSENVEILKEVFEAEYSSDDDEHNVFSPTMNLYNHYNRVSFTRKLNDILHKALGEQYSTHSF